MIVYTRDVTLNMSAMLVELPRLKVWVCVVDAVCCVFWGILGFSLGFVGRSSCDVVLHVVTGV